MKKILFLFFLCSAFTAKAADEKDKVEGVIATDIVSQYVWRGIEAGSMSLQPTLGLEYKGLSLTGWGSVGIVDFNDTKELDLTLAYAKKGFNVGVTDYWFSAGADARGRYFAYKSHSTNHVFEGNVGYDFGFLSLQWFTVFGGNDGVNKDGKRAYSSYFEISAPFRLAKMDWNAAVGIVPYATSMYNAEGFRCTNVSLRATKDFNIKNKVHLPLFGQLSANPCDGKFYFIAGFSIQPQL